MKTFHPTPLFHGSSVIDKRHFLYVRRFKSIIPQFLIELRHLGNKDYANMYNFYIPLPLFFPEDIIQNKHTFEILHWGADVLQCYIDLEKTSSKKLGPQG